MYGFFAKQWMYVGGGAPLTPLHCSSLPQVDGDWLRFHPSRPEATHPRQQVGVDVAASGEAAIVRAPAQGVSGSRQQSLLTSDTIRRL